MAFLVLLPGVADFESAPWHAWAARAWPVPWALAAAYLLAVWRGRGWLAGGAPLTLARPLLAWNLALAAFSVAGLACLGPALAAEVAARGAAAVLCPASAAASAAAAAAAAPPSLYARGARGAAMLAFMLSKVPELADTAFLLARGRPVSLLHAWHHASVMVYCWLAYGRASPSGFFFAAMNFAVHALMYGYFAAQSAGARIPRRWGALITRLQIAQMVAGCALVAASAAMQLGGGHACEDPAVLAAAACIYASYLVLFVQFFFSKAAAAAAADEGGPAPATKRA